MRPSAAATRPMQHHQPAAIHQATNGSAATVMTPAVIIRIGMLRLEARNSRDAAAISARTAAARSPACSGSVIPTGYPPRS